jgi:2-phosphoglycerate kinase
MKKPIILIAGSTGVGTTTFSFELAKALDIPTIISSGMVREVIRSVIAPGVNPTLDNSTYSAGQTVHYCAKSPEVQKAEILRAYKIQCTTVNVGIEGVLQRSVRENIPLIVEGVHIIPGKVRESGFYELCKDRLFEFIVYISENSVHRQRFLSREREAPDRPVEKYLKNFREIRWIHDYLLERANRFESIRKVNNVQSVRNTLDQMLHFYFSQQG